MPEVAEVECCRVCDSEGGCAFAMTCPCHRKAASPIYSPQGASLALIALGPNAQLLQERSLRDLEAAAREVPRDRWADQDFE